MERETRLVHAGRDPEQHHGIVNFPLYRASTILYPTMAAYERRHERRYTAFGYGIHGTPTTMALGTPWQSFPGAPWTLLLSSGLSAVTQTLAAFLRRDDHLLVADTVYGPTRGSARRSWHATALQVTFYDPLVAVGHRLADPSGTASSSSPSVPGISVRGPGRPHHRRRRPRATSLVVLDNTWATPLHFRALKHGVDVEIQALTKFVGGHSDLLLGAVTTRTEDLYRIARDGASTFGDCPAPDVCYEALRGLRTLAVRLRHHEASALRVAEWLARRPEVARVLHPALPEDSGHAIWKRDFRGSSSLFGVLLRTGSERAVSAMVDGLRLFKIGASFGGFESLIVPVRPERTARPWREPGFLRGSTSVSRRSRT